MPLSQVLDIANKSHSDRVVCNIHAYVPLSSVSLSPTKYYAFFGFKWILTCLAVLSPFFMEWFNLWTFLQLFFLTFKNSPWSNQHLIIVPCVIVAAAEKFLLLYQSNKAPQLMTWNRILPLQYTPTKTNKQKKNPFIHVLYMSLKTYNCCERQRRKEKENINCLLQQSALP
jgi:hypothetical protein